MTGLADIRGINMTSGQAMTARAGTIDLIVIHADGWRPDIGGVAGLANIGGIDVTARQAMA